MAKKFSKGDVPTKADDYHGGANYLRTTPDVAAKDIDSINIELTFEQAIRLSVAIQSCVMQLNTFNRAKAEGKEMGLLLSLKTARKQVTVIARKVREKG